MSGGASAILLLARSATTGAALKDMERLRDHAAGLPGAGPVVFAVEDLAYRPGDAKQTLRK